jgi:hypothetical protein
MHFEHHYSAAESLMKSFFYVKMKMRIKRMSVAGYFLRIEHLKNYWNKLTRIFKEANFFVNEN